YKEAYYRRFLAVKKTRLKHSFINNTEKYIAAIIIMTLLVGLGIGLKHRARAVGGYNSSDVVGQVDGVGNGLFNSKTYNKLPSMNNAGFLSSSTALDSGNHRMFVMDCDGSRVLVY